jgi:hypothetical protein
MRDQASYDGLDSQTLSNLLLNPGQRPEIHRMALSALSRRAGYDRTKRLLDVLRAVIQTPDRYDQRVMTAAIDILATDPDPGATEAMLHMLPAVLQSASKGREGLSREFREYFYEVLVTRRREEDIEVWREELPKLDSDALAAMLFEPAGRPLQQLDPLRLIARLPKTKRREVLGAVFSRALFRKPSLAFQALELMLNPNRVPPPSPKRRSESR